jgi:hypothetical protein
LTADGLGDVVVDPSQVERAVGRGDESILDRGLFFTAISIYIPIRDLAQRIASCVRTPGFSEVLRECRGRE